MTPQDTMRLALEALEYASTGNRRPEIIGPAIDALRSALAQQPKFTNDLVEFVADALTVDKDHARALMSQALSQQGEPETWIDDGGWEFPIEKPAAPAAQPLSIEEIEQIIAQWNYEIHGDRARYIARMVEQAHGIGAWNRSTEMSHGGKGSAPRKERQDDKLRENWERIFGRKKDEPVKEEKK